MGKRPVFFVTLCLFYGIFCLFGYALFGEGQWIRDLKNTEVWRQNFVFIESLIKGKKFAEEDAARSLVWVGEIRGNDSLLIRDFSSLVFRPAHENEFLKGRNVLLTKAGVHARLWLVDHDTWLEMKPNTLIVLDEIAQSDGSKSILNLNILAGSWGIKNVSESELDQISDQKARENIKKRLESRKLASQGRGPSSQEQLPGIMVKDFMTMKEYQAQSSGLLSEVSNINVSEDAAVNEFWGDSATVEGGSAGGIAQEIEALGKMLENDALNESLEESMEEVPVVAAEPKVERKFKGSHIDLSQVIAAETQYISSAMRSRKESRSPAASAIGLSVALERASSSGTKQFNSALSQVLSDYVDLYIERRECGMLLELNENIRSNYPESPQRLEWERQWTSKVQESSCRQIL